MTGPILPSEPVSSGAPPLKCLITGILTLREGNKPPKTFASGLLHLRLDAELELCVLDPDPDPEPP